MKRAFTLIEMLVVVAIIVIILALVMPVSKAMWDDSYRASAIQQVRGMLGTAKARAAQRLTSYGVVFYIDKSTGFQNAAFITSKSNPEKALDEDSSVITSLSELDTVEYRGLVCDRFELEKEQSIYAFHGGWRVGDFAIDSWEPYSDKHNFFVIVFTKHGKREFLDGRNVRQYIIRDTDGRAILGKQNVIDDVTKDGKGDITGQPVVDVRQWRGFGDKLHRLQGFSVQDILDIDGDGQFDWWPAAMSNGIVVYNHNDYQDIAVDKLSIKAYVEQESYPIFFDQNSILFRGGKGTQ